MTGKTGKLKGALGVALIGMLSSLAVGCGGAGGDASPVLARVGGATLTQRALEERVPPEIMARAGRDDLHAWIDQWVRDELLYQEARAMGYQRDARVRQRLLQAERDIVVDTFLEDELDLYQMISEREIETYWRNNQELFRRLQPEASYLAIWFESRAQAQQGYQALAAGARFEDVATDTTLGVLSVSLESTLAGRFEMGDELADIIFRLRPGQLGQPAALGDVYVVARVVEVREAGSVRELEVVRDEILSRLLYDLRELKMEELISRLQTRTDVSVDFNRVNALSRTGGRP